MAIFVPNKITSDGNTVRTAVECADGQLRTAVISVEALNDALGNQSSAAEALEDDAQSLETEICAVIDRKVAASDFAADGTVTVHTADLNM
jgi:predicted  nucleic acid-binding Zn-ribbon protein